MVFSFICSLIMYNVWCNVLFLIFDETYDDNFTVYELLF